MQKTKLMLCVQSTKPADKLKCNEIQYFPEMAKAQINVPMNLAVAGH
jgi:hypothetical protein